MYIYTLISAKLALERHMRNWYCWLSLGKTEWIFQEWEKIIFFVFFVLPMQRWINDVKS